MLVEVDKVCVHCKAKKVTRPRSLCRSCYFITAVRRLYPAQPALNSWEASPVGKKAPLEAASQPTSALPGSEEKIAVLMARATAGVDLWHPRDAGMRKE